MDGQRWTGSCPEELQCACGIVADCCTFNRDIDYKYHIFSDSGGFASASAFLAGIAGGKVIPGLDELMGHMYENGCFY